MVGLSTRRLLKWWGLTGVTAFIAACPVASHAEDPRGPPATPSIATSLPANGDPFGTRAALAGIGVTYGMNYIGEVFDVVGGGQSRGTTFDGRVEGYTDIDLEKFMGWRGAKFHANVFGLHGEGPTTKHVHPIAPVSGAEALETVRLYEVWLEQDLFGGKLNIRYGQLAADSEFWLSDTAGLFLNGTFGWPAINAADMPQGGPAYPFATPAVRVRWQPNADVTVLVGLFNSLAASPTAADPQRGNRHGTNFRIGDPPLLMAEGHFKYDMGLPGMLRLGGWQEFNDFADQRTGAVIGGNYGFYAILDQEIWKTGDNQSISIFARASTSPQKQNTIDFYGDAGVVFSGFVASRPNDKFGAAFGYGNISARARAGDRDAALAVVRDYEAVLELNYRAEIVPGWTLTPNLEYYWHPGGHVEREVRPGEAVNDALVIGARTTINY